MQFLKTLFWAMLTALVVIFASRNWFSVTVSLWGGLAADIKLPILLLFAFLVGFVPCFILYRASIWQYRRRTDNLQRALDDARSQLPSPPGVDPADPAAPVRPQPNLL